MLCHAGIEHALHGRPLRKKWWNGLGREYEIGGVKEGGGVEDFFRKGGSFAAKAAITLLLARSPLLGYIAREARTPGNADVRPENRPETLSRKGSKRPTESSGGVKAPAHRIQSLSNSPLYSAQNSLNRIANQSCSRAQTLGRRALHAVHPPVTTSQTTATNAPGRGSN